MTTRAILEADVYDWLEDAGFSAFDSTLRVAEADIGRRIMIRQMQTTDDIDIDAVRVAVPTGYIKTRRFYLNDPSRRELNYLSPEKLQTLISEAGQPRDYTEEGEEFAFHPAPSETYTGKLLYFKRFDPLVEDDDTNWLLTWNFDVYLFAVLANSSAHKGEEDPRIKYWEGRYLDAVGALLERNKLSGYSGSLRVIPRVSP